MWSLLQRHHSNGPNEVAKEIRTLWSDKDDDWARFKSEMGRLGDDARAVIQRYGIMSYMLYVFVLKTLAATNPWWSDVRDRFVSLPIPFSVPKGDSSAALMDNSMSLAVSLLTVQSDADQAAWTTRFMGYMRIGFIGEYGSEPARCLGNKLDMILFAVPGLKPV